MTEPHIEVSVYVAPILKYLDGQSGSYIVPHLLNSSNLLIWLTKAGATCTPPDQQQQ